MTTKNEAGIIRKTFKPNPFEMAAGFIIGGLLFVGGIAAAIFVTKGLIDNWGTIPLMRPKGQPGWDWVGIGWGWILSLLLLGGGWFFVWLIRLIMPFRVGVGTLGLAITERTGQRTILWDEIEFVQEEEVLSPRRYGLPPERFRTFEVKPREGEPLGFGPNDLYGHLVLASYIKKEAKARSIPWMIQEDTSRRGLFRPD